MYIIYIAIIVFVLYVSIFVRTIVFNPQYSTYYGGRDLYEYIKYKKWLVPPQIGLVCYQGLFGKGKTLSAVHKVVSLYERYNDKQVYYHGKWITQKIQVLSNVELNIPYTHLSTLQQIVDITKQQDRIDEELNIVTYTVVLLDELSVNMNSRNFKTNISTPFLNALLTSRHFRICGLFYTSQRFNLCDKLLRDVTTYVVDCNKIWRVMCSAQYDAWSLENASDVTNIKPMRRFGWFIRNKDFNAYNTMAVVDELQKACEEGAMLSDEEILLLREAAAPDINLVQNQSKKFIRQQRKRNNKK